MTQFIAISGRKQCGKDTLARYLTEAIAERREQMAVATTHFADPLKEMCHIVFGIPRELLWGTDEQKDTLTDVTWDGFSMDVRWKYAPKEANARGVRSARSGPMTVREMMQVMGTEIFREQVELNVWANAPFRKQWDADLVLIPDCRFSNEVEATLRNGGHVIRLERETGLTDVHVSESALDDFDFARRDGCTLVPASGNQSLEDLRRFAATFASKICS